VALKRGKKEDLKDYLSRTGYAHQKLAKVKSSARKKNPSNPIALVTVGIVVIIIISVVYFMGGDEERGTQAALTTNQSQEDIETENVETSEPRITCKDFTSLPDEISCEDAIELALEKYPGEYNSVDKTQLTFSNRESSNAEIIKQDVWLIGIDLKEPIQSLERIFSRVVVSIDRTTGNISPYRLVGAENA
jgi:hypothetical protein|tara:strand:+ start:29 stop:601 length:573 start_codon:yes stop_codon:yes gene_type:complete